MQWKYTLSEPTLGLQEQRAAVDCLKSGWLSMGGRTLAFEEKFTQISGCRHAIAVSSGTAALHLSMLALGIGNGDNDEVIQPSINFVAGANMTMATGAKPVFADIVSLTEPTIDPSHAEDLITSRTKAVMVVHYGGYPARMREIVRICRERNIPIIEDACHATGYRSPKLDGAALGTIGDIGCYSFFANKNMTTGEGGMIATNNDELAATVRNLRSHGMTTLTWERHKGRASTYDVIANGYNYRIDDLRSALGLVQLEKLPDANKRRQNLALAYAKAFEKFADDGLEYAFANDPTGGAAHLAVVIVDPIRRDEIRATLQKRGIQTSMHYPPAHELSAFNGCIKTQLPKSQAFAKAAITLPLYPDLPEEAIAEIVGQIVDICRNGEGQKTSARQTEPAETI